METVPGITNDRQIKKFDKPKSGGTDSKSRNDLMIYKDVSHRSIVKEDRIRVDGPVLGRNLQAKGHQGSSSTSDKPESIATKHAAFEKKLERVDSEYPAGGGGAEQHFERVPALLASHDAAPVISIFPKSMDATFVKEGADYEPAQRASQQKRQAIPISESNKVRYKNSGNSHATGTMDAASRSSK